MISHGLLAIICLAFAVGTTNARAADPAASDGLGACERKALRIVLHSYFGPRAKALYAGRGSELYSMLEKAGVPKEKIASLTANLQMVMDSPTVREASSLGGAVRALKESLAGKDDPLICVVSPECKLARNSAAFLVPIKTDFNFETRGSRWYDTERLKIWYQGRLRALRAWARKKPRETPRETPPKDEADSTNAPLPDVLVIGTSDQYVPELPEVMIHELTHFTDMRLLRDWIQVNESRIKAGIQPDPLYRDFARYSPAEGTVIEQPFFFTFLEGRAYQTMTQAKKIYAPPPAPEAADVDAKDGDDSVDPRIRWYQAQARERKRRKIPADFDVRLQAMANVATACGKRTITFFVRAGINPESIFERTELWGVEMQQSVARGPGGP